MGREVTSMPRPSVPFSLLFPAVAALWAPVGLVLAVLVATAQVSFQAAVVAGAVIAIAIALIVRPYLADILALRNYTEAVAHRDDAPAPRFVFRTIPAEIAALITRLHRAWMAKRNRLASEAEANLTVLDRLPDPLILFDRSRRIVWGNLAARTLLGGGVAGRDLSAVLRYPDVLAAADEVLSGRDEAVVEFVLRVPVERYFFAGINRLPKPTSSGTIAILRLHDMTEIKRTEQMRGDFVANVSHELKTPLTTLLGYIETLRGPAKDDPAASEKFLQIMSQQAARMNNLVEDLLSLSRIELHEHRTPTERVDIAQLVRSVADSLQIRATAKGQTIEVSIPPQSPATRGDALELSQVFENLLENAVRYGAPDSTIRVTLSTMPATGPAARVAVSIADEGEGIPREHLPRLTERFYRVDPARSRELGGTGLGLAIVKHIVSRHRGDLKIESELGKGSTFTVILPADERASVESNQNAAPVA